MSGRRPGTDHYFSGGGGGGGGDEKSLSANLFFFYLCTSANNFFLTTPSCKQFFSIFSNHDLTQKGGSLLLPSIIT